MFKKIFTGPFFYAFFTGLFWWQYASGGGQFAFWFAVLNTAMLAWQLYALWFKPSGGNAQLNDGSPKPNLKEWTVSVGGATIKVSNWWSMKVANWWEPQIFTSTMWPKIKIPPWCPIPQAATVCLWHFGNSTVSRSFRSGSLQGQSVNYGEW